MAVLSSVPSPAQAAARILAGAMIVAATVIAVGVGPFLRGIAAISPLTILLALMLAAVATSAAAWRWSVVAERLDVHLTWRTAMAAYYRSQFLNAVLPGGILGDVHRAYAHGRREGQVAVAARAVAVERIAGQFVQTALTVAVVVSLGLTSRLVPLVWVGAAVASIVVLAVGIVAATVRGRAMLGREYRTLRRLFARPRTLVAVTVTSTIVVAAHAATFVVAALAAGVSVGPRTVVVALIVLTASALPFNVGGWGPREAVSASAFTLIGLGAGTGLMVSAAFGVLTMVAVIPGAVVLIAERIRDDAWHRHASRRRDLQRSGPVRERETV